VGIVPDEGQGLPVEVVVAADAQAIADCARVGVQSPRPAAPEALFRLLADVCSSMQDACMPKDAAITVRIPVTLKRKLAARARRERRSLSSEVASTLERSVQEDPGPAEPGKILGRFRGRAPRESDFAEARRALLESLLLRWDRRGS
jgi:hypothetical protein